MTTRLHCALNPDGLRGVSLSVDRMMLQAPATRVRVAQSPSVPAMVVLQQAIREFVCGV